MTGAAGGAATDLTIPGVSIGHATDVAARTGCTVLIGPFRAACDVRGFATGSREMDALSPMHLVPRADALLLTGGSAFGLAAAEGVVGWLEARGIGFETSAARVPIVPAAVIYDLAVGRADRRPDAAMGRAACDAAAPWPPSEGAVGAGAGATVGKLLGLAGADTGGFGCWAEPAGDFVIGAVAVVNALGDVRDAAGRIIAGARLPDGRFADAERVLRGRSDASVAAHFAEPAPTNTTLAVIVTDAPFARDSLAALARMAATALARRITPVHTPFDGDIVFALSTAATPVVTPPQRLLATGATAAYALEQAIERAVRRDGA